jgi:hypothetical protein
MLACLQRAAGAHTVVFFFFGASSSCLAIVSPRSEGKTAKIPMLGLPTDPASAPALGLSGGHARGTGSGDLALRSSGSVQAVPIHIHIAALFLMERCLQLLHTTSVLELVRSRISDQITIENHDPWLHVSFAFEQWQDTRLRCVHDDLFASTERRCKRREDAKKTGFPPQVAAV